MTARNTGQTAGAMVYFLLSSIPLYMFVISPLDIDALKHYVHPDIYSSREVREILDQNSFRFLGWLNDGILLPYDVPFEKVYANRSGSYCIYVNHDAQLYYCVDMG